MLRSIKRIGICGILAACFYVMSLLSGHHKVLQPSAVSAPDTLLAKSSLQRIEKEVLESVCKDMIKISDWEAARIYFHESFEKMQELLNTVLSEYGWCEQTFVSFPKNISQEAFQLQISSFLDELRSVF